MRVSLRGDEILMTLHVASALTSIVVYFSFRVGFF